MVFRWLFGLPAAAIVTAGLFMVMAGLIRQESRIVDPVDPPRIDILPKITPQPEARQRPPRPIKDLETPPPPDIDRGPRPENPGQRYVPEAPTGPVGPGRIEPPVGLGQPTIKIAPRYPDSCATKGVEGVVVVEFDVTATGAVVNPRIISSPDSCFERTVLKAISGYKYSPRVVDGRAVPQRNMREYFKFELTE